MVVSPLLFVLLLVMPSLFDTRTGSRRRGRDWADGGNCCNKCIRAASAGGNGDLIGKAGFLVWRTGATDGVGHVLVKGERRVERHPLVCSRR